MAPAWWLAEHIYLPHPSIKAGVPQDAELSGGKKKLYCYECFIHHISEIQQRNEESELRGETTSLPKSQGEMEQYCKVYSTVYYISLIELGALIT